MTEDIFNIRLNKRKELEKLGIRPYGYKFNKQTTLSALLENFQEGQKVESAGRLVTIRAHGGSAFCDIKDHAGRIQIYLKKDVVGKENYDVFKHYIDIGDIIGVEGELFKTHKGQITINVSKFSVLSKSLRPLPEKWHGLKDVEVRYRHRSLDLISNDKVKDIFVFRTKLISEIRKFFDSKGYLEVETPILHQIPGGAAGRPFKTHHNTYEMDLFLRIAPELFLKRLLVGGFDKVYEINKSFRNEGISPRHNPEFTMLEAYTAYADYNDLIVLIETLISKLAGDLLGTTEVEFRGKKIDLATPWKRISFAQVMKDNFGITPDENESEWVKKLKAKGIEVESKDISRTKLINIIGDAIKPKDDHAGNKPVFVTDYFTELCPLAKTKPDDASISERFELYMGGIEVANAYSELNDPVQQRERFMQQLDAEAKQNLDEDFLAALEHGMPPAAGLGIGIDRLVMILTNSDSIREVILFPLLKPEK